jgi:hypothetical protein
MGDHPDLVRVDVIPGQEPPAGGVRHGDDRAGIADDRFQHLSLMTGRFGQDGVQHDDGRHPQAGQQQEHLVAVGSAEDAELVLHDDHVTPVEPVQGSGPRPWISGDEIGDRPAIGGCVRRFQRRTR